MIYLETITESNHDVQLEDEEEEDESETDSSEDGSNLNFY